ncbi:hypothetical protein D3C80_2053330 [compost metagenome]
MVNHKMPISEVEQMNRAQYVLLNRGQSYMAKLEAAMRDQQQEPTTIASSADDLDDLFDGPRKRRRHKT